MSRFFLVLTAVFVCAILSSHGQQKLTLEEAVLGQFRTYAPQTLAQCQWLPGTEVYTYLKDNTIMCGKLKSKADSKLLSLAELNAWKGGEAMLSMPQLQWIDGEKFSFTEENAFYEGNLKTLSVKKVVEFPADAANNEYHQKSQLLAYTRGNNLYLKKESKEIEITKNEQSITSGQAISRNEYGIEKGIFWNSDGSKLVFYQKDEKNVTNYPLVNYKEIPAVVNEIKYPMAGGGSEIVQVGIFDVASSRTVFLKLHAGVANDQFYATNISWSPDNKTIYLAWLNRATTDMQMKAFDSESGKELKTLFTEHDDQWLEPLFPALFIPNHNDQFIWMSERDGFNQLHKYDINGKLLAATKAPWEITSFLGFDTKGDYAFVMGTGEMPTENHCYKVKLSDMDITPISHFHGTHQSNVSSSGMYVIDQFSSLTVPNKIDILNAEGRLVKNLITATDPYVGKSIGKPEIFTIKSKDGTDLYARIIKPSNFDENKKYPVLVYLYNGPHVQLVTDSHLGGASLWMNQLAEEGFIIFTLDGHGSDHRGKQFEEVIHRQLGNQEIADQMLGVEWLKQQKFVDSSRMAIHGWSYGGFMTTSMMLRQPGVFKVGVAGGPVIDWAMYEVMYGERYMDTPAENPEGYKAADLTQYVKNLQGKLLMIHGVDDNVVVMQHNMKFLKACVDNKVQVDFFAYPGHEHNVRGKDRVHLMTKVIAYVKDNLK